jgi:acylglycerol lipase
MRKTENLSNGGLELFYRSWRPGLSPRAVVVIVPGFNSHSGYYEWVAEQLTTRGLAAYAIDLRGRGQSEGERFYVDRFEDYVSDVHTLVTLARSRDSGLPIFLLGHSAGGVVACLYAAEHQSELAGLICESFAFKVPAPDVALSLLKGLSHVAPHAHVLRLKNEDFSRDPAIVHQMNGDPLIADEKQPTQTVAQMVRADQRLEREFPNFKLPLLILHGTSDKATKPSGSRQFYAAAGSRDKTLKLYDGAYHDLLNDTDRDHVMSDVTTWIESHV